MELDGVEGCKTLWMYLIPLNCTLKNDEDVRFCVICILPLKYIKITGSEKQKIHKIYTFLHNFIITQIHVYEVVGTLK